MTDVVILNETDTVVIAEPTAPTVVVATSGSGGLTNVVALTQAQYDALVPDPTTLYVIIQ